MRSRPASNASGAISRRPDSRQARLKIRRDQLVSVLLSCSYWGGDAEKYFIVFRILRLPGRAMTGLGRAESLTLTSIRIARRLDVAGSVAIAFGAREINLKICSQT